MTDTRTGAPDEATLAQFLTGRIAEFSGRPEGEIAGDVPMSQYGVDSVSALTVCAEIEDHFDVEVEPTLLWDHPTIEALASVLAAELTS